MIKVCTEYLKPSLKTGKVSRTYQQQDGSVGQSAGWFCRTISSVENDNLLYEVGLLCLRTQETFEIEAS